VSDASPCAIGGVERAAPRQGHGSGHKGGDGEQGQREGGPVGEETDQWRAADALGGDEVRDSDEVALA
jgi:hypothetical protein